MAFAAAIEIDPKRAEAYEKLADTYLAMGDEDSALQALWDGYDATGDDRLQVRIDELTVPEPSFALTPEPAPTLETTSEPTGEPTQTLEPTPAPEPTPTPEPTPMPEPTPTPTPSSDFQIENGVLTKYSGPGGAVTIPNGVTRIGERAFEDCDSMTSITIPTSVTSIGESAFYDCGGITSVYIPDSVTNIEGAAFYCCSNLASANIPNGITTVPYNLYSQCALTSIVIPYGVTSIGGAAFTNCTSLVSVTIPSSVTFIDMWAFDGCNLSNVYYSGSPEQWASISEDDYGCGLIFGEYDGDGEFHPLQPVSGICEVQSYPNNYRIHFGS